MFCMEAFGFHPSMRLSTFLYKGLAWYENIVFLIWELMESALIVILT